MFRFLSEVDEDPFMMDPFAAHRQHMRSMFDPFGMDPFALAPQMQSHRPGRRQASWSDKPLWHDGDGWRIHGYVWHDGKHDGKHDSGAPQVYQQTSETRTGPGGIRETRQSVRDSESGLERLAIGHHIRERAHIMERSRNRRTGDREERQDFINLDESEAAAFDDEWRREAGRYSAPNIRGLEYGRDRWPGGQQLALTAPPSSTSPSAHRHESPRHRQPQNRPRYDW